MQCIQLNKKEAEVTEKITKKEDRSTWAVGGSLIIGLGVGFFFLPGNPLAFVGSIFMGLGLGLVITAIISERKG